jgi:hypothetical protein
MLARVKTHEVWRKNGQNESVWREAGKPAKRKISGEREIRFR